MEGMVTIDNAISEEVTKVFKILDRYFEALESGTAEYILLDPTYRWKHKTTLGEMRELLAELDEYWWNQRGYTPLQGYDAGPSLSRLPDNAVWALAQEIDAAL